MEIILMILVIITLIYVSYRFLIFIREWRIEVSIAHILHLEEQERVKKALEEVNKLKKEIDNIMEEYK